MKILNKFLLLTCIVTLLAGCTDQLIEIEQPGRLNPEAAFETVADLNNGLLGAYAQLDYTTQNRLNAVLTDEASIGFDNGGQGLGGEYNFVTNPTSGSPTVVWTRNYDALNFATRVILAAPDVTIEAGEQQTFNSILGQAYAIRAFAHFTLLTYYSEDMADDNSMGIILLNDIPEVTEARPRNTTGEVFSAIISDLDQAESLIPASLADVTRFTQDAVTAMRARIATYRQNYTAAEQYSQELLDKLSLADRAAYTDMFRLDTDGEVIFKLERTIGDIYSRQAAPGGNGTQIAGGWAGAIFAFVAPDIDGSPFFEMGRTLFDLLDEDDIRYQINVSPTSVFAPPGTPIEDFQAEDIIPINKYRGNVPGEGQPLMNDLKIFRVSEMLFINAEAEAALGNLGEAASLIQQLQNARFGTTQPLPVYANAQEAFGDILDERRIELAFEGHRWVDLGRLGERANRGIDRDPRDCQPFGACDAPVPGQDHRFRLAIPLAEIDGNNVIQQNPGYSGQ